MDFEKILNETEKYNISEAEQFIVVDKSKEARWKAKRIGKITSSKLPDLMRHGRKKEEAWGEVAKKILFGVKYERRTGKELYNGDNYNFYFGRENEPKAIEWIRSQGYKITHSDDLEDIIFHTPFDGFGDSPDFIGKEIVGEIKCTVNGGKYEEWLETEIDEKTEYYYQLIGHFIGMPEAEKLMFVIYDSYNNEGCIKWLLRKDYITEIEKVTSRIKKANEVINMALKGKVKICDINKYEK